MNANNNMLKLAGTIKEITLAYTDEEKGEKFYRIILEVDRLSENIDTLPVICSEKLLFDVEHEVGSLISITGYIRTRNYNDEEGRSHLDVFGYVHTVLGISSYDEIDAKTNNIVKISGHICRPVRNRKTLKTKREITDLVVAVNRPYERRDYIPCIAWSRNAVLAANRSTGDKVYILGRFQDRQYRKKGTEELLTAYEVSVIDLQVLETSAVEEIPQKEEQVQELLQEQAQQEQEEAQEQHGETSDE